MIRAVYSLLGPKVSLVILAGFIAVITAWGELKFYRGYEAGVKATEANYHEAKNKTQQQVYSLSRMLSDRTLQLEQAKANRVQKIKDLEDEALSDNPGSRAISDASVRRLQERWDRD